ncbi:hypothetical protein H5410_064563, partial [Solanum commersonii]
MKCYLVSTQSQKKGCLIKMSQTLQMEFKWILESCHDNVFEKCKLASQKSNQRARLDRHWAQDILKLEFVKLSEPWSNLANCRP